MGTYVRKAPAPPTHTFFFPTFSQRICRIVNRTLYDYLLRTFRTEQKKISIKQNKIQTIYSYIKRPARLPAAGARARVLMSKLRQNIILFVRRELNVAPLKLVVPPTLGTSCCCCALAPRAKKSRENREKTRAHIVHQTPPACYIVYTRECPAVVVTPVPAPRPTPLASRR